MSGRSTTRVLITGGARGLGLAIAREFLSSGPSKVTLADIALEPLDRASCELIDSFGKDRVAKVMMDVTDGRSVDEGAKAAADLMGGIDALVTCAGVISRGASATHDWALWERDLSINLGGTYRCSRAVYPHLCESTAASIVTIASLGSFLGMPQRPSYNSSKSAVVGLTRTLAAEWGPDGIRVNAVAPGFIETEMMRSGIEAGVLGERKMLDRMPLRRLGDAGEVAPLVVFLTSRGASYITGAVVPVDGGLLADGTFF